MDITILLAVLAPIQIFTVPSDLLDINAYYLVNILLYTKESVNRSQVDIKHKICDIIT
jgi:hypothetical protein